MSVRVMSAIFDRYPNGGGEMLLALALADHAHDDGTSIRPSVKTLAAKTRQSERTVQYQLRKMQDYGWLILSRKTSGKPGDTNVYRINPEWLTGAKPDGCNFCTGAIDDIDGCNPRHRRVQNDANTGAIAVAPKPFLEPSKKQPSVEAGASAPAAPAEQEKPEAYIDRITRQDSASHQVTMSPDWKPGSQFPALMLRAGLTADRFTDEILAKFQIYHNGTSRPQNKWEAALVTWCKRENTEKPKPPPPPPVEKKTEYWGRDPKRMMTPDELAVLHAGRALLK